MDVPDHHFPVLNELKKKTASSESRVFALVYVVYLGYRSLVPVYSMKLVWKYIFRQIWNFSQNTDLQEKICRRLHKLRNVTVHTSTVVSIYCSPHGSQKQYEDFTIIYWIRASGNITTLGGYGKLWNGHHPSTSNSFKRRECRHHIFRHSSSRPWEYCLKNSWRASPSF